MPRHVLAATLLAASTLPALAQSPQAPLIALSCASCHGPSGAGQGSVPPIAGHDRAGFLATWAAFRANERPATIMGRIARGYTEAEVAQLADYFANLR